MAAWHKWSERPFNDVTGRVSAAIRSQHIVRPVGRCLLGVHMGLTGSWWGWWHSFSSFEVEEETEVRWFCFCNKFSCSAVGDVQPGMVQLWKYREKAGLSLQARQGNEWVSPSVDFKLVTGYKCINVFVCGALWKLFNQTRKCNVPAAGWAARMGLCWLSQIAMGSDGILCLSDGEQELLTSLQNNAFFFFPFRQFTFMDTASTLSMCRVHLCLNCLAREEWWM